MDNSVHNAEGVAPETIQAAESSSADQPRASTSDTTSKPVRAAHETFVRPGKHHEHHIGVDGPIGRESQISGLHGTDARRTSKVDAVDESLDAFNPDLQRPEEKEPTLTERNASLDEGVVIEPFTGLPMNVGKYGKGAGGTDGAPQIEGFDEQTHAERLALADKQRATEKEITWEKIRESDTTH